MARRHSAGESLDQLQEFNCDSNTRTLINNACAVPTAPGSLRRSDKERGKEEEEGQKEGHEEQEEANPLQWQRVGGLLKIQRSPVVHVP